jgi:hypothetical protein
MRFFFLKKRFALKKKSQFKKPACPIWATVECRALKLFNTKGVVLKRMYQQIAASQYQYSRNRTDTKHIFTLAYGF